MTAAGVSSGSSNNVPGTTLKKFTLRIRELKGSSFPNAGCWKRPGKFYIKVNLDGVVITTTVSARGNNPVWEDEFFFEASGSSTLIIEVYVKHKLWSDKLIGSMDELIDSLLSQEKSSGVMARVLTKRDSGGVTVRLPYRIEFTVDSSNSVADAKDSRMQEAISQAKMTTHQMEDVSLSVDQIGGPLNEANFLVQALTPVVDPLEPFLSKVKLFTEITNRVTEIHPYAKIAWSVLSIAYKVILAQRERDNAITGLVKAMDDAFSFVTEAEPLKKIESHKEIITTIVRQTTECAYFIRDYSSNKNFWERTVENLTSSADGKIDQYTNKFKSLKSLLQERGALQTEITVLRILDNVSATSMEANLMDMHYAKGAGYTPEKGCLPGTREAIIDEIVDWVNLPNDNNVPRIFWLSGVAGSGKSAIAHTIARRFDDQKRLGSSFCFDASNSTDRCPYHLFSTISVDLADLDQNWRSLLWNVIKDNRSLRTTMSIQSQFDTFILRPADNLSAVGPVVVIVDALDESGDQASRKGILDALSKKASSLPSNFRILITSRPERDIQEALGNNPHIRCQWMDSIDSATNEHDISAFIRSRLCGITSLDVRWPNEYWRGLLVEKSEGLFQWAATACLFIQGNGEEGLDPCEQLEILLSPSAVDSKLDRLDSLYLGILKHVFPTDNEARRKRFILILGRILSAKMSLPISALSALRSDEESPNVVELTIKPLGSLLSGVSEQSKPVKPLHTSFRDFLVDPRRSGRFYVHMGTQDQALAMACLRVMKASLRFNICQLETSEVFNDKIPRINTRVTSIILPELTYSCRFWAEHLWTVPFKVYILNQLDEFIYEHLLHWLEVLSLTRTVDTALHSLALASEWCKDESSSTFLIDAHKFIAVFANAISRSAPHIYISALPFAPRESLVSRHFLPKYPRTLDLRAGHIHHWPAVERTIEGHNDFVSSLAISQDGKFLASSSKDKTILVWSLETGLISSGPFRGHEGTVYSIKFSRDGKRVISGSADKTIRFWDVETGNSILEPIKGHTGAIFGVDISPDDKYLVSSSEDKTLRIWDTTTGRLAVGPLEGHTDEVDSVVFSPDGKYVFSGSTDMTVRMWDAQTGKAIAQPLQGHIGPIRCIAVSANGKHVASGSVDQTIQLWDLTAGGVLSRLLEGHEGPVLSLAFSRDGNRLVSGSWDQTVRIWDTQNGAAASGPLTGQSQPVLSIAISPDGKRVASGSGSADGKITLWDISVPTGHASEKAVKFPGHEDSVECVAFSPNSKFIASCSSDGTVCVWDAQNGTLVVGPLKGHGDPVLSVALSQDGKRIASGSVDQTIRIWDTETGGIISEPLEGHTEAVYSVAFSLDGRLIASGSGDRTVRIWEVDTGKIAFGPFEGHADIIPSIAFSQDGRRVVSCSLDKTVRVWDVQTGMTIAGPMVGHTDAVFSVALSPDSRRVISGSADRTIRVWDTETGIALSEPFQGHTASVYSVAFSQDGKRIASGSGDNKIIIWDAETGSIVHGPWEGHTGTISSLAFSQDGTQILSGSDDTTIRVWAIENSTTQLFEAFRDVEFLRTQQEGQIDGSLPDFNTNCRMEQGWILGAHSKPLLWVPPWHRPGLWWPRNVLVISKDLTILDFSNFVHGAAWGQCRK